MELGWPAKLAVWVVPVLLAITVHEVAHGWVARILGDRTAEMMGRLTLNPIKHIDPVGTVLVPGLLFLMGGFLMGWAKPVPVAVRNLRRPRRDMALVAAAGPGVNLLMAIAWALVARLALTFHQTMGGSGQVVFFIACVGVAGVMINVILMVLNLLPVPPLDGGRVLAGLVPPRFSAFLDRVEPFGLPIVLVLLVTGALSFILSPMILGVIDVILGAVQLPPEFFARLHAIISPR